MNWLVKAIVILSLSLGVFVAVVFPADRASGWDKLRDECVAEQKVCQYCGTIKDLQAHHILEFSIGNNAKYELVKANIIVLCREDHLRTGHNGSFLTMNPFVREECEMHRAHMKKYAEKIRQLEKAFNYELGQTMDGR